MLQCTYIAVCLARGKCREHYWGETEPPSRLWLYWEWASPCHAQSLSWANFPSVYPLNPHNIPVRPMLIVPVFADEETRTQRSYMTRSSSQSLWRVEMGFQTRSFDFGVWALDFQIKRNVLNTINLECYSPSWLFRMVVLRLGCTDDPLEGPGRQAVPGHAHPTPRVWFNGYEMDSRTCSSNKSSGAVNDAGPGAKLWEPLIQNICQRFCSHDCHLSQWSFYLAKFTYILLLICRDYNENDGSWCKSIFSWSLQCWSHPFTSVSVSAEYTQNVSYFLYQEKYASDINNYPKCDLKEMIMQSK